MSIKKTISGIIFFIMFSFFIISGSVDRETEYKKHLILKQNSIFKSIKWKGLGPYFMGGRITDIVGYNNKPYSFFIATASGGLWKTKNNGTTWESLFDNYSSITLGDIAISQTNENLIWAGTGEENSSRSSYAGTGVFKSLDGGKTWANMGLQDSHHIAEIIIDPTDNNIVFVASLGHLYTLNKERGVFKTENGGKTWKKTLYISNRTGIVSLVMDPKDNKTLYAASWERERKAWNMTESGVGSSIYKSVDGGETWNKVVKNFPQDKNTGRIGLSVSRSNPAVIYAFLDNQTPRPSKKKPGRKGDANYRLLNSQVKGAEVYRSNDRGGTWFKTHEKMLSKGIVSTYGYYFGQIYVSPDDENIIYILGVPLKKSIDGGKTFKTCPNAGGAYGRGLFDVHPDHQALWIDPKNPGRVLLGNDGGLNISYDGGDTFTKVNNIPLAQSYSVNYDMEKPYRIYTGLQDNGINIGPSNFRFGSRTNIWKMILGGDGAFIAPDLSNPNIVYAEFQFGNIFRIDMENSKNTKWITPKPENKKESYRFNWLTPFMISHHNPYTLYMGGNKMFKTVNRGDKWFEISKDLTNKKNIDGDVPFATITALDESPLSPKILYAGTDDGNVWVTKNMGAEWDKINVGLPNKWITRIVASKFKKERVFLTMTGYRDDDFKTYVFLSNDFGKNWKSIKSNLPDESVNVIREDIDNENILYLGTELTAYITLDLGKKWISLRGNLPTNAVYDLRIHPREKDLIIGTHGRGVFITSVKNIQKLTKKVLEKEVHIFEMDPFISPGSRYSRGKNKKFEFYLKNPSTVEFKVYKEKQKKAVWKIKQNYTSGKNYLEWDMKVSEKILEKGKYILKIKSGKNSKCAEFEVK